MPNEIGPVVDLQDIFAAPILAVIKANVAAAREFVAFIEAAGFVRSASDPHQMLGDLRMVTFSYEEAGSGRQPPTKRLFSVPVLSLIPLPLLEVKDATFDFGVRLIAAYERHLGSRTRTLPEAGRPDEDPLDVDWRAMLATGRPTSDEERKPDLAPHLDANMEVRVNVGQADVPAGIQNLIALLGQNARLSSALLTVSPTERTISLEHPVATLTLNVLVDRNPSAAPPGIGLLYAANSGIEVRTADDQPWPSGETRQPNERGILNANVSLAAPIVPNGRTVPVVFRTQIDGAVAFVELICIVQPSQGDIYERHRKDAN